MFRSRIVAEGKSFKEDGSLNRSLGTRHHGDVVSLGKMPLRGEECCLGEGVVGDRGKNHEEGEREGG